MTARNTPDSFGWITRLLHWLMAAGIVFMLALGTYLEDSELSLSTLYLFGLHKSVGLTILSLAVVRLTWHAISPPPAPPPLPRWQAIAARVVRWTFYVLLLAIPVSGWVGSDATGIPTLLFGVQLPSIAPASESLEEAAFEVHEILTKLLFVTLLLHVAAAIRHAAVLRDGTLTRMIRG